MNNFDEINTESLFMFAVKGEGFASAVIKFFTRSQHSHVGIYDNATDTSYESVEFKGVLESKGLKNSTNIDIFKCFMTKTQKQNILAWLKLQVGKPYDWTAVSNVLNYDRDWKENNKWFCSELIARAFELAGIKLTNKQSGRVTPGDCVNSIRFNCIM